MKHICGLGQSALVSIAVIASSLTFGVTTSWAESPTWLCVPKTAGKAVTSGGTGTEGKCEAETTTVELPPAAELPTLVSILSHVKYVASGIDSKPTIKFEGVNVQIVNGAGKTATTNGEGNLVVGYDENVGKHAQTGSHNLILGEEQTYTSYGGILAGAMNSITEPGASVTGGKENHASKEYASVSGGWKNAASGELSSISGGDSGEATGRYSSISGGNAGTAAGESSSVSGGADSQALGEVASVSGGISNRAKGGDASISGGSTNTAEGNWSSISGGYKNETSNEWATVGGGSENKASGKYSSVFGGKLLTATKEYEALL